VERESRIARCGNSSKEEEQFLTFVSTDFFNDRLPFVVGLEHDTLGWCTIFRRRNFYEEPLIGKISLDGANCTGFHKSHAHFIQFTPEERRGQMTRTG
jgi:hypothetical protein